MDDIAIRMMRLSGRGYCCSQILVLLALEGLGRSNRGLVRAMHGLCHGMGHSGEVCGVLSGGVCLLGYYAGKGGDDEPGHPTFPAMVQDLVEWFREDAGVDAATSPDDPGADAGADPDASDADAGADPDASDADVGADLRVRPSPAPCKGIRCSDILEQSGGRPDPARCGAILSRTYSKVLEILMNEGFDPLSEAPDEDE